MINYIMINRSIYGGSKKQDQWRNFVSKLKEGQTKKYKAKKYKRKNGKIKKVR